MDGSGLVQLTDGPYNDFDPCRLPDGRIAFVSERRGGYIRCFAACLKVRSYTLFSMRDDGSDVRPLSYFETSEWNPSVNNDGRLVYTRRDYVDRENCLGTRFWVSDPDGANPLIDPIPLRPRPPIIPPKRIPRKDGTPAPATIAVMNVYNSDLPFPEGVKIKWLRIVQNIPKSNHAMGEPMIGYERENTPRIPLGVMPVEEDGSAFFEAPVAKPLIFQALDENFMAVQSMRSSAFARPGEHLSCLGCHAPTHEAAHRIDAPRAMRRPPLETPPRMRTRGARQLLPAHQTHLRSALFALPCGKKHTVAGHVLRKPQREIHLLVLRRHVFRHDHRLQRHAWRFPHHSGPFRRTRLENRAGAAIRRPLGLCKRGLCNPNSTMDKAHERKHAPRSEFARRKSTSPAGRGGHGVPRGTPRLRIEVFRVSRGGFQSA